MRRRSAERPVITSIRRGFAFFDAQFAAELLNKRAGAFDEAGSSTADIDFKASDRLVGEIRIKANNAIDFRAGQLQAVCDKLLHFAGQVSENTLSLMQGDN